MTVPSRDDAEELGRVVRDFLAKWSNEVEVRRLMATDAGLDPHVWARMAELGLPGLVVPERFGGGGATAIELGGVFEELGAGLYAGPFFPTVGLAATALPAAGDEDASARHLPGIAAGTTTATLAWAAKKPATSPLVADRRPDRHARTRGHALHDADDDRVHAVQVADDAVQALCEVVDELLAVVRGGEAAHVALDAEDPALAPQQDDAGVVGTGTPNGTEQLRDHLLVQRMPLSPAERVMRAAPSVNS